MFRFHSWNHRATVESLQSEPLPLSDRTARAQVGMLGRWNSPSDRQRCVRTCVAKSEDPSSPSRSFRINPSLPVLAVDAIDSDEHDVPSNSHPRCVHTALVLCCLGLRSMHLRFGLALQTQEIVPFSSPLPGSRDLAGLASFELTSWDSLLHGARPSPRDPDEFERAIRERFGWQHKAASWNTTQGSSPFPIVERTRKLLFAELFWVSWIIFCSAIQSRHQIELACFSLPLPFTVRNCRGRPLDFRGHHRATCSHLGRRGCAEESAATR